jgi:hypothetical protein
MLLCKQSGCSGIWYTLNQSGTTGRPLPPGNPRSQMSKTAAIALTPSNTLFGRFLARIDQILMASANAAVRNGDLPYFGL